jgi:HEAT repeat protein
MRKQSEQKSKVFNCASIIRLLESEQDEDSKLLKRRVRRAKTVDIAAVLSECHHPGVRRMLCYALGRRGDAEAVPVLIDCLRDPELSVCTEAAEALGNIGDGRAGPALLARFYEREGGSRNLLAYALGAVGYRPAIPLLRQALSEPELQGSAAVALGSLGAQEARADLESILSGEIESESTRRLVERGLAAIELIATAPEQ